MATYMAGRNCTKICEKGLVSARCFCRLDVLVPEIHQLLGSKVEVMIRQHFRYTQNLIQRGAQCMEGIARKLIGNGL
jgi:hypothetical protein